MGTRPPNQRLLWFTDDNSSTTTGNPRKWLILKESNILNSGYGVFAARPFKLGDIITKYIGVVANLETKSGKRKQAAWGREGSAEFDYRLALEQKGKKYLIAANSTQEYLFGHFIQHSDEPNCAVESAFISRIILNENIFLLLTMTTINYIIQKNLSHIVEF